MVEHVGASRIDLYARQVARLLRPAAGCSTTASPACATATRRPGPFSERYVFPDAAPLHLSRIQLALERAGIVTDHVEGLPGDYATTLTHWLRGLEDRLDDAIRLAGPERVRVWRLYLRTARKGFETGLPVDLSGARPAAVAGAGRIAPDERLHDQAARRGGRHLRWQVPGDHADAVRPARHEQVAITHRHMTPKSGGKGGYGHRHKTQEEIYFVVSGTLEFKLDDEVLELEGGTAVRVAPEVVRSVWNEGPGDAELIIVSTRIDDPRADAEMIEDFWPE